MCSYVSVEDFGAEGNAVTDCTYAFQEALDKAGILGQIILVPAGQFRRGRAALQLLLM